MNRVTHGGRAGALATVGALAIAGLLVFLGLETAATSAARLDGANPSNRVVAESGPTAAVLAGSPSSVPNESPSASPATGPTASPIPATRPATLDRPVPTSLRPSLATAARDYPKPYLDGCHTGQDGHERSSACAYGNLKSKTTIALFGDSHALSWFPAVERLATRQGWRLLNVTMSACTPATVPVWNSNYKRVSTQCAAWRARAISQLVKARPAVVLVSGTRGFSAVDASGTILVGDARTQAWEAGMQRTLGRLVAAAGKVIVIGDTPLSVVDPPVCLSAHRRSVLACATPVARAINDAWLEVERGTADRAGAGFIDPSLWVCPTSPCPAILANTLIYRNPGHLTAVFAGTLSDRLRAAVLSEVETPPQAPAAP